MKETKAGQHLARDGPTRAKAWRGRVASSLSRRPMLQGLRQVPNICWVVKERRKGMQMIGGKGVEPRIFSMIYRCFVGQNKDIV